MICWLRSRARSSSRPNWLGCTNGSRVSKLVEITSRATSSTERVASTEPSRCERRSSVAFAGSDTSYSDTIVSAAPSQLVVTTSNRSPSSSSWWLPFGSSGWPTTCASATRTMRNPSLLATYTYSPSVSTMSPSSTPTSWVFVPENVSAAGGLDRRRSDGCLCAPLALRGRRRGVGGGGRHHVAAHRDDPAAEAPRRHPFGRLGLHVAEEGGAVAEERQVPGGEALWLRRLVGRRRRVGVGRRGRRRLGGGRADRGVR